MNSAEKLSNAVEYLEDVAETYLLMVDSYEQSDSPLAAQIYAWVAYDIDKLLNYLTEDVSE